MKLIPIVTIAVLHLASASVFAGGWAKPGCAVEQPCAAKCRQLTCRPVVKIEKVKKSCFTVDCEDVCIPAITFPWQKKPCGKCDGCADGTCGGECFTPKCGRVISVRVLGSEDYEVEECVCEWNIEEVGCEGACKPECGPLTAPGDPLMLPSFPGSTPPAPQKSSGRPPLFNFRR